MSVTGRAAAVPGTVARTTVGRRWAWVPTLLVGVALFELVRSALVDTGNPNLLPSLILLGASVIPASFVAVVYGRRLAYDVSGLLLAFTALGTTPGSASGACRRWRWGSPRRRPS